MSYISQRKLFLEKPLVMVMVVRITKLAGSLRTHMFSEAQDSSARSFSSSPRLNRIVLPCLGHFHWDVFYI